MCRFPTLERFNGLLEVIKSLKKWRQLDSAAEQLVEQGLLQIIWL